MPVLGNTSSIALHLFLIRPASLLNTFETPTKKLVEDMWPIFKRKRGDESPGIDEQDFF